MPMFACLLMKTAEDFLVFPGFEMIQSWLFHAAQLVSLIPGFRQFSGNLGLRRIWHAFVQTVTWGIQ